METKDAIYSRRATRNYRDEPVPRTVIEDLIWSAVQAPSAINEQPWAFVVIEDREVLKTISDRSKELMREDPAWLGMEAGFRSMVESSEFNIFYNAPELIIICAKPLGAHPHWDCCFAAENLMLRATEMGLASCVIGFSWEALKDSEIKRRLKIPEEYEAILPIIVGYPAEHPAPTGRKAPEILNWIGARAASVAGA